MTTQAARAGGAPSPRASMAGVARGGAVNLVGAVVTGLANFLLAIGVTRGLSRSEAGIFFSVTSLFLIAMALGQLGTNTGLVYFLSRCRAVGRIAFVTDYIRVALRPVLVCGLGMAVTLFLLAPAVADLINPGHAEESAVLLRVLAIFIPLAGLENVALSATRGLGTMKAYALVELVARPSVQLVLVAVSVFLLSGDALAWAWAAAYVPAALVSWWWLRRLVGRLGVVQVREGGLGREFWRFTSPRAGTGLIQMAMQRLDIVLVGALAGPVSAAVYTAATRFIVVGQMGNNAISMAAQPGLAVAIGRGDRAETNYIYQTSTAWLMALTWPLFLTLAIFGDVFIGVFGDGYEQGSSVLLLLSLAMLLATGLGMVDMLLSMAGHTTWNLANAVLALVVQVGLDVVLIPSHGVMGAAIGWSAAIVTRNVSALVQVAFALRLHPFGSATAASAGLCVGCYGVAAGVMRAALGESVETCVASLGVATVVFVAGLWLLRGPLRLEALVGLLPGRRA